MAKMTIAPTTPEDVRDFLMVKLPYRIKAMTARVDDRIVAIGGLTFLPGGTVTAFLEADDEARKHPVTLHKAVLAGLKDAKANGYRVITALADECIEAAPRWLKRLGFEPRKIEGETVFTWHH